MDVRRLVGRDAREPRPEAVGAAQCGKPAPSRRQRFLQRVVRVALVPQLDSQVAVQPRPMPYDQRFEGRRAPQLRAPHELGVLDLDVSLDTRSDAGCGFAITT